MCLGEVVQVTAVDDAGLEVVDGRRTLRVSALTLETPAQVGDWLVVHAGLALARLDPAEAADARRLRGLDPVPTSKERP